jgi:Cu/Ag efflux protein CusF
MKDRIYLALAGALMLASSTVVAGCGKEKVEVSLRSDTAINPAKVSADTSKKPEMNFRVLATVTKVNEVKGTITIEHEKMEGYMVTMEMPYKVGDPEIFKKIKVGTKGHFTIEVTDGIGVITGVHVHGRK